MSPLRKPHLVGKTPKKGERLRHYLLQYGLFGVGSSIKKHESNRQTKLFSTPYQWEQDNRNEHITGWKAVAL